MKHLSRKVIAVKKIINLSKNILNETEKITRKTIVNVDHNPSELLETTSRYSKQALTLTSSYVQESLKSSADLTKGIYYDIKHSNDSINELRQDIENQGSKYREFNKNHTVADTIIIGGESLNGLLNSNEIPEHIEKAYEAAYPNLSEEISFIDKVKELNDIQEITGFISGVKGKLFELEYIDYLNSSNLPNGYVASIADNANQQGWDIAIKGPNGEVAELLQAKATDSIYYVQQALDKHPTIDVVTTDEVYSHLVMSGISDNIINSGISLSTLTEQVEYAVDDVNLNIDFSPPAIALAFIAFTSYKNNSLTLYEKAKYAGSRSGKTYLSYLIGSGMAAITNTWWIGVLSSVTSRYISDSGLCKYELTKQLKKTKSINQKIINQLSLYK